MAEINIKKLILPVVSGTMAGMILQVIGEKWIHSIYPPPPGISPDNKAVLEEYISHLPSQAFLLMLGNYALCSFVAGLTATFVSGRNTMVPALVAGGIITMGGVFNATMIPQPVWFSAVSVLLHLPMAFLGYVIAKQRQ